MASKPNFDIDFISYFLGNETTGAALYRRLQGSLLRQVRRRAPDLPHDLAEDVVMEVFALMKERRSAFDPEKGSAQAFITVSLLPEALRRIRAENAPPGVRKRERKASNSATVGPAVSIDAVPAVPSVGYGSPAAIEAACDARLIWNWATPPLRVIMGGFLEGKAKSEIASSMNLDRFKVDRMIRTLHSFAIAA